MCEICLYRLTIKHHIVVSKENKQISEVLKTLANPLRIGIVRLLEANGEMSVTAICNSLKTEQSLTSHHLNNLRQKKLITNRRNGKEVIYSLSGNKSVELLDLVKESFL